MIADYERYQKHILLPEVGIEGQEKLHQARVLVVGAGGLGCPVLQYLTAAGVGIVGIIDADIVSLSNLQRQILYRTEDIGRKKVEAAKEVLQALNPDITIHTYPEMFTEENADLLSEYDIVVDCTDNLKARYVINDACVKANKPFVYGSIYRFEGQVAVFNYQNGPTYRCLFDEGEAESESPNCAEIGVLGVLPGIIGTYQALEVVKFITGIGELLSGKLLMINTLHNIHRIIKIKRRETIPLAVLDKDISTKVLVAEQPEEAEHAANLHELTLNEDTYFIDVRENPEENTVFPQKQTQHIPLSQLAGYIDDLPREKPIVVFCQSGLMSNFAFLMLSRQYGFTNVSHLEGGLDGLG